MDPYKIAADRQRVIRDHLTAVSGAEDSGRQMAALQVNRASAGDSAAYERKLPSLDDVVVVSALRTALTKARRGGFKDTPADDLLCAVLEAVLQETGVEPESIGDLVVGTVLAPGSQRAVECRVAMLLAGLPDTVPVRTVNRQCSSGLQAVADVAAAIKAGFYTIGIAAGLESMTLNPMDWKAGVNPRIADHKDAANCMLPMGVTSENVAAKFGVDRATQDKLAARSHARAAAATNSGRFKAEIVPVKTVWKHPETGEERQIVVDKDDGIREGVTESQLAKLPPVFKKGGSTTAGNSSQVSDGASAVLLMTRREALRRGLPIMGIFRSFSAVGVDPAIMGIGPSVAIPAAVDSAGLQIDDIDLFELNEAFASQATYCCKKLDLDMDKVNVNGGAIALGHPLGCTGARCTATLLHEMAKRGRSARFGVVSMCIGSGMGAAAVFERNGEEDSLQTVRTSRRQAHLSPDAVV